MELVESVEDINKFLVDNFGLDNFRVVFSRDQYEKRIRKYNDRGEELLVSEVAIVPKYNYVNDRYVLERNVPMPGSDLVELLSWEPIWTFEDKNGNYLPPRIYACKFIIENLLSPRRVKENLKEKELLEEAAELKLVYEQLFGNESEITDALCYREGVSMTGAYPEEKSN